MTHASVRRSLLALLGIAGLLVALLAAAPAAARGGPPAHAGGPPAHTGGPPAQAAGSHEIWMLDQGTDLIHVHDGRTHREVAAIDVSLDGLDAAGFTRGNPAPGPTLPHMIDFDSQYRYAFVAATAGASTIVIDTRLKEVVAVVATGGGSHMAAVTPDDTAVWTAAIGAQQLVEIPLDLDAGDPSFSVGRVLSVPSLLAPVEAANPDWRPYPTPDPDPGTFRYASYGPVCHDYSPDSSEAWVTLGPAWNQGGLFVLDLDSGEVTAAWNPADVRANCGLSVSEDVALVNWSGDVVMDADTAGEWYVVDRPAKELLQTRSAASGPVEGLDAHGLRLTPDGSHYWQVNRSSSDGLVIDAATFEVVAELTDLAEAPDILDFSPDGSRVYISQRGPHPRTGAVHAATGPTPGVRVLDADRHTTIAVIEPPTRLNADGEVVNDIHGVGVRPSSPGEQGRATAERARGAVRP